jgi:hypothetical protein
MYTPEPVGITLIGMKFILSVLVDVPLTSKAIEEKFPAKDALVITAFPVR